MNQTNAVLKHVIGKESKIVVRNSSEVQTDDFFFLQYKYAIKVAEKIVENTFSSEEDCSELENINNIIAFIGDRGSGKTSCMLTFANILTGSKVIGELECNPIINSRKERMHFYQLPAIDPSFFSEEYNIIGAFIAAIYKDFKEVTDHSNIEQGKTQDFYRALAEAQQSFARLSTQNPNLGDDMERLEQLSCSMKLKGDIKSLTKVFLDCVGQSKGMLLLCIDDIDLNTKTAVKMVEWIRKYLLQPNILILFAVKLDQLMNLKRLSLLTEYKELLSNKMMPESEIDEMAERYMVKLFPLFNRVYMPNMTDNLYLKYEVISSDNKLLKYKTDH